MDRAAFLSHITDNLGCQRRSKTEQFSPVQT